MKRKRKDKERPKARHDHRPQPCLLSSIWFSGVASRAFLFPIKQKHSERERKPERRKRKRQVQASRCRSLSWRNCFCLPATATLYLIRSNFIKTTYDISLDSQISFLPLGFSPTPRGVGNRKGLGRKKSPSGNRGAWAYFFSIKQKREKKYAPPRSASPCPSLFSRVNCLTANVEAQAPPEKRKEKDMGSGVRSLFLFNLTALRSATL